MYTGSAYRPGLGGLNNGQYWAPKTQASGRTTYAASTTNVGTLSQSPGYITNPSQHPFEGTVEDAGIRVGEITAIRVWMLKGGLLRSVYMDSIIWVPGEVMKAHAVSCFHGEGIHAFKSLDRARGEYRHKYYIYGEVALWGEVIEHDHGYKAEYAKITKIYSTGGLFKRMTILRLRRKYGV